MICELNLFLLTFLFAAFRLKAAHHFTWVQDFHHVNQGTADFPSITMAARRCKAVIQCRGRYEPWIAESGRLAENLSKCKTQGCTP